MKHFTSKTQKIGEIGEEKACMFLVKQGFRIIERNSANKFGEIDIVAKKGNAYYFFEVKTGKRGGFVNPGENLTKEKLRKLFISVSHYCLMRSIKQHKIEGIIVLLDEDNAFVERIDLS